MQSIYSHLRLHFIETPPYNTAPCCGQPKRNFQLHVGGNSQCAQRPQQYKAYFVYLSLDFKVLQNRF